MQYHFVFGTIKNNLTVILDHFRSILETTKKIIVIKHRLPDATIDFYCNIMNVDSNDRSTVTKKEV